VLNPYSPPRFQVSDKSMPQSLQPHWAVTGFRWVVTGIDLVLGLCLTSLGVAVTFGTSLFVLIGTGRNTFRTIPDEILGILVIGFGVWLCVCGIRLITELTPLRWQAGKRRHGIAALATVLMIALMWVALMTDKAMSGGDGFGFFIDGMVYTGFLACAIPFFLVASAVMSRLDRLSDYVLPHGPESNGSN